MDEITKEEKKELQEIFSPEKEEDIKDVFITRDKEQFAIKIPRDFAREIRIDKNKDLFRFVLTINEKNPNKKMLYGELIKNEKKKTND